MLGKLEGLVLLKELPDRFRQSLALEVVAQLLHLRLVSVLEQVGCDRVQFGLLLVGLK